MNGWPQTGLAEAVAQVARCLHAGGERWRPPAGRRGAVRHGRQTPWWAIRKNHIFQADDI